MPSEMNVDSNKDNHREQGSYITLLTCEANVGRCSDKDSERTSYDLTLNGNHKAATLAPYRAKLSTTTHQLKMNLPECGVANKKLSIIKFPAPERAVSADRPVPRASTHLAQKTVQAHNLPLGQSSFASQNIANLMLTSENKRHSACNSDGAQSRSRDDHATPFVKNSLESADLIPAIFTSLVDEKTEEADVNLPVALRHEQPSSQFDSAMLRINTPQLNSLRSLRSAINPSTQIVHGHDDVASGSTMLCQHRFMKEGIQPRTASRAMVCELPNVKVPAGITILPYNKPNDTYHVPLTKSWRRPSISNMSLRKVRSIQPQRQRSSGTLSPSPDGNVSASSAVAADAHTNSTNNCLPDKTANCGHPSITTARYVEHGLPSLRSSSVSIEKGIKASMWESNFAEQLLVHSFDVRLSIECDAEREWRKLCADETRWQLMYFEKQRHTERATPDDRCSDYTSLQEVYRRCIYNDVKDYNRRDAAEHYATLVCYENTMRASMPNNNAENVVTMCTCNRSSSPSTDDEESMHKLRKEIARQICLQRHFTTQAALDKNTLYFFPDFFSHA